MVDIFIQILVGLFVGVILLFIEYFYFLNDKNNKKKSHLGTTYMHHFMYEYILAYQNEYASTYKKATELAFSCFLCLYVNIFIQFT